MPSSAISPNTIITTAEKTFKYNNIEQGNRNPLVQRGTADGLKTGHTEAGGYGLVASTLRGNRRVILVLNGMDSMHQRAEESERLMDWAFANFEDVTLFAAGDVVERVPVWLGTSPTVPLVGGRDLMVTMPRNWRNHASMKVSYDTPIQAPVAKGDAARQAGGLGPWRAEHGCAAAGRRRMCRSSACPGARWRCCRTT